MKWQSLVIENENTSFIKKYLRILFESLLLQNPLQRNVLSGPFVGMKYVKKAVGGAYYPRLLGTYELELSAIIEEICQESFETIINVGAGEGYYAVGFALRNTKTNIIAFESDSEGRKLLEQMVVMNCVEDRIRICGACNISSLLDSISPNHKSLIVIDVEGAEVFLLDPLKIPHLVRTYILVELHELRVPDISTIILDRFCKTHIITKIDSRERVIFDFPKAVNWKVKCLPKKIRLRSMDEGRGWPMSWFYLKPKS